MKYKLTYATIALLCCFITTPLGAQTDNNYLQGAVPEIDGRVAFGKTIHLPNTPKKEIIEKTKKWMETQLTNELSKVVYSDFDEGVVVGVGLDTLVFTSTFISLDQAEIRYQIMANCTDNECSLTLDKIVYIYQNDERITAEEMISDKVALNKSKTKINRGCVKWRTNTIDFANKLLNSATQAIIPSSTNGEPRRDYEVKELVHKQDPTQVVILDSSSLSGKKTDSYKSINPNQLPGNIIKLINEKLTLVSVEHKGKLYNNKLTNGSIGVSFNKPSASLFIPMNSEFYTAIEKEDSFTISFYTEAYREELSEGGDLKNFSTLNTPNGGVSYNEAWLIIECKKTMAQSIMPDSYTDATNPAVGSNTIQKLYIGEITHIWIK